MTSPLCQVIPGKSHVQFPITFEPSQIGLYQRSLSYVINNFYRHYVKIIADVRLPTVQLSTDKLVIRSLSHHLAEESFRKVVHLYNPLNALAEFRWVPVIGPKGTAFSIRPATGKERWTWTVVGWSDENVQISFRNDWALSNDWLRSSLVRQYSSSVG